MKPQQLQLKMCVVAMCKRAATFEGGGGCFGWPLWDELKPFNLKPNQTLRRGFFCFLVSSRRLTLPLDFKNFPCPFFFPLPFPSPLFFFSSIDVVVASSSSIFFPLFIY